VHWLAPPGLHQVGRPNPNGFGWTIPPAGAAIFSKGALRARVYFEGGSARPTEALRNKPSVSCVGREQGHSCANALGACRVRAAAHALVVAGVAGLLLTYM
jgi:cytochrome b